MQPLPLLKVQDLKVYYPICRGLFRSVVGHVKAVDGVSFSIPKGTTMGLVGESGSGKSTLGKALMRLVDATAGSVYYEDVAMNTLSNKAFFPYRKRMQMIFQDPFNSLNPRITVGESIAEPLGIHFPKLSKADRIDTVATLLKKVGLEPDHMHRYPHAFSGGQRQRIGIARALAVQPECIICDEPVSALDVSVQAQIINLLKDLQDELGLTYLFIAHDLAVVKHMSDHICVMQQGRIVEDAPSDVLYNNPQNSYTQHLLSSVL